jgi:hypothetical protein
MAAGINARHCVVLAFESVADLPPEWALCDRLTLYGPKAPDVEQPFSADPASPLITLRRETLDIATLTPRDQPFDSCFVRHPDPWGEPRSWLCAIAALGECLTGTLTCVVHRDHEALAFNHLLIAMLGQEHAILEGTRRVDDPIGERHLAISWRINPAGVQREMQVRFRRRLRPIIRNFYVDIGRFHRNVNYFPDAI